MVEWVMRNPIVIRSLDIPQPMKLRVVAEVEANLEAMMEDTRVV